MEAPSLQFYSLYLDHADNEVTFTIFLPHNKSLHKIHNSSMAYSYGKFGSSQSWCSFLLPFCLSISPYLNRRYSHMLQITCHQVSLSPRGSALALNGSPASGRWDWSFGPDTKLSKTKSQSEGHLT